MKNQHITKAVGIGLVVACQQRSDDKWSENHTSTHFSTKLLVHPLPLPLPSTTPIMAKQKKNSNFLNDLYMTYN